MSPPRNITEREDQGGIGNPTKEETKKDLLTGWEENRRDCLRTSSWLVAEMEPSANLPTWGPYGKSAVVERLPNTVWFSKYRSSTV